MDSRNVIVSNDLPDNQAKIAVSLSTDDRGNPIKFAIDPRNSQNMDLNDSLSGNAEKYPEVICNVDLSKNESGKSQVVIDSRNVDVSSDFSENSSNIVLSTESRGNERKLTIDSQNLTGSNQSTDSTENFPEVTFDFSLSKEKTGEEQNISIDSHNATGSSDSSLNTEQFPEVIFDFSVSKDKSGKEQKVPIDSHNAMVSSDSSMNTSKCREATCIKSFSKDKSGIKQKFMIDSQNITGSGKSTENLPEVFRNFSLSKDMSGQEFKIDSRNVAISGSESSKNDKFLSPIEFSSNVDVYKTLKENTEHASRRQRNSDLVEDKITFQREETLVKSDNGSNTGYKYSLGKDLNQNRQQASLDLHKFSKQNDHDEISCEENQGYGPFCYMPGKQTVLYASMDFPFSATSGDENSNKGDNPAVASSSEIMTNETAVETDIDVEDRRRFSGQSLSDSRPSTNLQYSRLPAYLSTHSLYGRNDQYTGSALISPYNQSQPLSSSGFDGSMSKYTSNASSRTTRSSYQSPRSTRSADINTKSYDSPTRKNDVTSTRSYDSPSRLSQSRSGQSSRSSSVSSTVSEASNRGDSRQTSSSHITPSQSYGTAGGSTRSSRYGVTQTTRATRNGSGKESTPSSTVSARSLRGSESEIASPKSTETERKRFGYTGSRPLSGSNKDGQTSIDIVAERFGGIEARRSFKEKQDDQSRFGTAATRRSARNVPGEAVDKTSKDAFGSSVPRFGAPLRKTHKTTIPEADESTLQLKGREIQRGDNSQAASRIDSVARSSRVEDNKERFGGVVLRRSLRETNGNRHSADSVTSDSSRGSEVPSQTDRHNGAASKTFSRDFDSSEIRGGKTSRDLTGTSVLKSRMQRFSGPSKYTGAVEEVIPSEHKTVPSLVSTSVGLGLAENAPKSEGKVTQRSSDRSGKTPAENFLRRAEMRSSLRQQSRETAASTEQTLAGDVFKRGSLRSTLPLKKEPFEGGSFERTEQRRSLRGSKYSEFSSSQSTIEDETQPQQSVPSSSFVEAKRSELMTKAASEAENVDRFSRSTSRKSLREHDDRPISSNLEPELSAPESISHASSDGALTRTEKPVEESYSHSTPNRSRIPKRNEVDSSAPIDNRLIKSTEMLDMKFVEESVDPSASPFLNVKLDSHSSKSSSEGRLSAEGQNVSARKPMPAVTPGSANFLDMSVGDSFSVTPSESREERIRKYKAERRKQLAANRFQDSPISKYFIKKDDSKEEQSKGGLDDNVEMPIKVGSEKMVLTFDSEVSSGMSESLQTQSEETMSKRPRPEEGREETEDDAKPKRRKSGDEEPAPSAEDIRGKLRRLQISAATIKSRAQLADKATAAQKESTTRTPPEDDAGKLKASTFSFRAETRISPSDEVQQPHSPKREESKMVAPSSIAVQSKAKISPSDEVQQPHSPKREKSTTVHPSSISVQSKAKISPSNEEMSQPSSPKKDSKRMASSSISVQSKAKISPSVEEVVQPSSPTKVGRYEDPVEGDVSFPFIKEPSPQPQVATLRYSMRDGTITMPEDVAATIDVDDVDQAQVDVPESSFPVHTETAMTQPEYSEELGMVASKASIKKSSRQQADMVAGRASVKKSTRQQADIVSVGKVHSKPEIMEIPQNEDADTDRVASIASVKKSSRQQAEIVSVGKVHSKSEVIEISQKDDADTDRIVSPRAKKHVSQTASFIEPERYIKVPSSAASGKTVEGSPRKVSVPESSVSVERKVAQVHPYRQEPIQKEAKGITKSNLPEKSQKSDQSRWQTKLQQQFVEAEVYQQVDVIKDAQVKDTNVSAHVETREATQPLSPKTLSSGLKSPQQKAAELHEGQSLELSLKAATTAKKGEVKSTASRNEPLVENLKGHHHISASLPTETGVTLAADPKITPVVKIEPPTPIRLDEKRPGDAAKKTPVKVLQEEVSRGAKKTPESPDNLDELLQRNQKYLEAEVKKKLERQQHVVGSSSSEAEKPGDGTLAAGGGKKKRISPQMRRRIKERSKSRERSEAEKEAIKKAQEVSAAELLASPEMKLPAEIGVGLHEGQTVQPAIKDLKDESKKRTDSDSTMTSMTESLTHSVTGSEEHGRKKRKDKSSARKSQLNAQDSTSGSQGTPGKSSEQIALESTSTPKGQRTSERTKTTPVTPEEVQQATEQVARQREQRIAELDETDMKTSVFEGRVSSHDLAKRELRPMGITPNRVSSALSKFQNSGTKTEEVRPKATVDVTQKSSKPFSRGKDFSSLLEKFSSSDSSEETERQRRIKVNAKRLDFPSPFARSRTPSSDESNTERDRPRRTPERTGSLKERAKQFEGGAVPKLVQRSSSFKSETPYKSDFMKRVKLKQQEQEELPSTKSLKEPETDQSSKDMGIDLSTPAMTKDSVDANNVTETQTNDSSILEVKKMEEVIADPVLLNVLKSRRKHSGAEFHDAFEELPNGMTKSKSHKSEIIEGIDDPEVARVLEERRKDTDSKTIEREDVFEDSVESLETKTKTLSSAESISKFHETKTISSAESLSKSLETKTKCSAESISKSLETKTKCSVESSSKPLETKRISSAQSSSKSYSKVSEIQEKKQTESVQKTKIESKPPSGITTTKSASSKNIESSRKQELQRSQTLPERSGTESEKIELISTSRSQKVSSETKVTESSKESPLSSAGSLDSVEKPVRGILKRSSSSASDHGHKRSDSETLLDPELAKVLESRKKMVDSTVTDDNKDDESFEDRRDIIRREIAQTEIHKTDESVEEERTISISERIYRMENKIEEAKSCPVTPRTLSGFTTPRSRNRSGASTPRRESLESLDEESLGPRINPLLSADKHFMAKLERMAETEKQISEKRQKFNRRSRDDWRTRTLPVTLEEIQEADSLESVSSFRGLVRRKATINIFEQIKEQDKLAALIKPTEFPQSFRKEKKSRRSGRFKTAPITAAELGSIPEGHTLLDPLRHLHAPLSAATSKADSGILSGSDNDRDSVQSDSLRSLEMEIPEDDPTRLSVSARTSIWKQLEELAKTTEKEKPKNRSIGAKRMIEKKKRERSLTQPITEEEVKNASEFADTDQKSQAIQAEISELKAASTKEEGSPESEDNLSRMSLADKLKLFNKKPEERTQAPPPRSDAPVIRRRNRKQASRFSTQPVTTEEVEKASKISPLALSMAKPPENELLRCLPIAAQIEMMALHAEANLSQPSSRAGSQPNSRAGSQPNSRAGSQPSSRRNSIGAESIEAEDSGILKTSETKDQQEVKSILKHDGRKSSDSEIRGILKDGGKDSVEPRGILKHGESDGELASPTKSSDEPSRGILKHGDSTETPRGQKSALRRDSKGKSEGDLPRSILKRDSLEENKIEPDKGVLKKSRSQDFKESSEIRGILKKTSSTEVKSASCEVTSRYSASVESVQSSSSTEVSVASESSHVSTELRASSRTEEVTAHVSESVSSSKTELKSTEDAAELRKTSKIKNEAVARRRSRENRKSEAERYLTQPADTGASDKTPERKMKYGASRHHTQPITPEEKEAAEAAGSSELSDRNSGSIADRLNLLKKSGEEDWKRRVQPEMELPDKVKMRVKLGPTPDRPTSIADRLNKLGESQQRWTARVEETDVKAFTVEGKQGIGLDSPLTTKKRRLPKRELSFGKGDSGTSNGSSPLQSPSSEKIPLPKELISEGPPVISIQSTSSSSSKTVVTRLSSGSSDEFKTVEVPQMAEDSFDTFFSKVEEKMREEKIDVTVDDFDDLFLKSEDVLTPARRIRPKRRHLTQKRNPLKTQSVEIQQEYIEVRTGVAEMELKRIRREGLAKDSSSAQVMLAEAAVKGLQSKENFNIELRKTKDSKILTPGHTDYLPYKNLMLLHVKGRRHVQTRLVEPHSDSVNSGDSYILVTPDRVVNWNGKFSNVIEKAKAADIALFISQKRDLGYRSSSPALTIEEEKSKHVANKNFWSLLEGSGECQECGPTDEDGDFESYIIETNMIYKVNNNTLVPYEEFWGKIPKVEMLKVQEVLVFDFGSELYVWHGQQVSMEQRKMGMKLAAQLWERGYDYSMCAVNPVSPLRDSGEDGLPNKSDKRPSWAIFGKVNQNMETTLFKEKFFDWPESSRFAVRSKTPESFALKIVDVNDLKPYDAKLLIPLNTSPVTMMFEGSHVGRGDKWVEDMDGLRREFGIMTLEVNVWHVLEYDHFKLPKLSYGQFHDGDTYVVRWQYMITAAGLKTLKGHAARHSLTGRERCAYFFWQGHNSTVNEKGASALMTVELDEERGPQVRVLQGKEPPCFLNLFDGRTIIHIGKREEAETNTQGSHRLYVVRNELENETGLLEIPQRTDNLRSRTSFILLNVRTGLLYIWHGAKSPSHTRKLAVAAAKKLKDKCPLEVGLHDKASISISEIEEGSEKSEFWSAIGNKDRSLYQSLYTDKRLLKVSPRLFYMNSVAGVFEATEILNPARSHDLLTTMPFPQYDLYKVSQPGLFLLDDTSTVYLWQGWWPEGDEDSENVHTGSAQARFNTDRLCAMKTTIQYCKEKCPDAPPTAYLVYAGVEPLSFTNLFPFWEVDEDARDSNLKDGRKEGETIKVEDVLAKLTQSQYTLEELQERPLPEGVDPLKLETYLRTEEFEIVLDMSKEDFYAMPNWKQTKLKQKLGLF